MSNPRRVSPVHALVAFAAAATLAACSSSGGSTPGGSAATNGSAGSSSASGAPTQSATTSKGGAPITLAVVAELSGKSAAVGQAWKQGADQAVKEINAAGGILGRQVKTFDVDTQSDTAKSAAAIRYALGKKPFAVIGPVLSASAVVDVKLTQQAKVPEVIGGVADAITHQGGTFVLRANPDSTEESQVFAKFIADNLSAKKVAIVYLNATRGQSARDTLTKDLQKYNVPTTAIAVAENQTNFSGIAAKIADSKADVVYLTAVPNQDAPIISAIKTAGLKVTITGDADALSPTVSKLSKNASDGAQGVIDYSPSAPGFQQVAQQFASTHGGQQPTNNYFKSYIFTWLLKYAIEGAGSVDQSAVMNYIHGRTFCVKNDPKLLQSFYIDANGDPDAPEFVTKVVGGEQQVAGTVKPLDESKFASC